MSESQTYSLDQAAAPKYGEQFSVPTTFAQPEADFLTDDTAASVAEATSDAHRAYEAAQADERLVFTDRRGDFEIRQHQPEVNPVSTESNMLDDSYEEMIRARRAAAAQEAEHHRQEMENVSAIGGSAQIVDAAREFAAKFGLAA